MIFKLVPFSFHWEKVARESSVLHSENWKSRERLFSGSADKPDLMILCHGLTLNQSMCGGWGWGTGSEGYSYTNRRMNADVGSRIISP